MYDPAQDSHLIDALQCQMERILARMKLSDDELKMMIEHSAQIAMAALRINEWALEELRGKK